MHQLKYVQAVLYETLRLYPPLGINSKVAADDDTLPDGTFIRRGTVVTYVLYAMGRDYTIWGNDADVFRPERWLEMATPPDQSTYPVFHAGPRECPGRILAEVQMKACLAMLLPQFSFKLAVPADQISDAGNLLIGGNGLPFFLEDIDRRCWSSSTTANSDTDVEANVSETTSVGSETATSDFDAGEPVEGSSGQPLTYELFKGTGPGPCRKQKSGRVRQRQKRQQRTMRTPSPERTWRLPPIAC